ncbi:MAG: DUF2070 family protein [Candidatus Bathyarchaeia archaeon]
MHRENMDKAINRYSLLFTFPSYKKIVAYLFFQCLATGIIVQLSLSATVTGFGLGICFGGLLFVTSLLANQVVSKIVLRNDPILGLRRCTSFSLVSNLVITLFVCIATILSSCFGSSAFWSKIAAIGFFVSISLSFLVFEVLSFKSFPRTLLASVLQPLLFVILILFAYFGFENLQFSLIYIVLAIITAFISVQGFLADQNSVGIKTLRIPSIKLVKAFLVNWTEGAEKPFEEILEQLSEEREISVSLITFKTQDKLKTVIVVPMLHAGPFKNIGSSAIPSLIQSYLEKNLKCIVSVPHGISGHEVDLASQIQNQKFLEQLGKNVKFDVFGTKATPFVTVNLDGATAGCQIFGDCAFVTLTLAPKTMEDLPLELYEAILSEAQKSGLSYAIAVDAHNSIEGPFEVEKAIEPLKKASKTAIELACKTKKTPFEVGVAKVVPSEFSVNEGFGPGGITVTLIKTGNEVTAYVTIDGNNMVSGLREKILSNLYELGITNGEIFTTDTHMVNAVVLNKRGYNPVGEAVSHEKLMEEIKKAATKASENLESAEVSWQRVTVQGVKVIGEQQIDKLSLIVVEGAKRAKKTATLIFPAAGFLLTILLQYFV